MSREERYHERRPSRWRWSSSFTPPRTGSLPEKTGAELTARHRTYHTPYPGRLYAENIFVGKGNNIKNIKNSLAGDKLSAYLANDLVIDSEDAIVTMGNFYGFNDVNTIDKNNLDMMNEMARGSSSIIINSMEWPKDNAKIDIRTSAYIMGAAYINTSTPYQTGESVALKGNYEAYTAPVNGNYNESHYEY